MNDVLQVRHTDRFAQLSLEYIDRRELFSDIRFHLNMGKLRYLKTADKHCIDGVSRVRVLEGKINAFGRIHEFEARRKEQGFVEWHEQADVGVENQRIGECLSEGVVLQQSFVHTVKCRARFLG